MEIDQALMQAAAVISATLIAREHTSLVSSIDKVGATFELVYSELQLAKTNIENHEMDKQKLHELRQ